MNKPSLGESVVLGILIAMFISMLIYMGFTFIQDILHPGLIISTPLVFPIDS